MQGILNDDGGVLTEVLAGVWLGSHDGLSAVHSGRGLVAEFAVGFPPALELHAVLSFNIPSGYRQL